MKFFTAMVIVAFATAALPASASPNAQADNACASLLGLAVLPESGQPEVSETVRLAGLCSQNQEMCSSTAAQIRRHGRPVPSILRCPPAQKAAAPSDSCQQLATYESCLDCAKKYSDAIMAVGSAFACKSKQKSADPFDDGKCHWNEEGNVQYCPPKPWQECKGGCALSDEERKQRKCSWNEENTMESCQPLASRECKGGCSF